MGILEFPRRLLREKSHSWNLLGTAATPGQTATNVAVLIRSDGGGFWSATLSDVALGANTLDTGKARQRNATLLWRAIRQICDGGVSAITVPRNDALFRPWPVGLPQGEPAPILHDTDGTSFSDGSSYYQSTINVTADAADLRDTTLNLTILQAGQLIGGESFSIRHETMGWRLYEIATVIYSDPTHAQVTFLPPLREAIADDTEIEFDRPRCTMRLAMPNAMDLTVTPWTFNSPSVQFIEAFA